MAKRATEGDSLGVRAAWVYSHDTDGYELRLSLVFKSSTVLDSFSLRHSNVPALMVGEVMAKALYDFHHEVRDIVTLKVPSSRVRTPAEWGERFAERAP